MVWRVPKMWQDGECYILGGGQSMPSMFGIPQQLINDVVAGKEKPSAYSPYFEPIHNKHSIAINQSFRIGTWMDMLFFGDNSFYLPNERDILQFPKLKASCHARFSKKTSIKYLKRDARAHGISSDPSTVCWNSNSGAAAISIAANAGCKRIVLLGFDMQLVNGQKHWHNLYKDKRNRQPKKVRKHPNASFHRHLEGFERIARDAQKRNIEILNCSSSSRIEQFKKVTLKDIL
jgi:hypothetical protein